MKDEVIIKSRVDIYRMNVRIEKRRAGGVPGDEPPGSRGAVYLAVGGDSTGH